MASAYPAAKDTSFPGYPYQDNTQYILAAYADAWVLAIQAIEQTVGYGSGANINNPLYSQVLNITYSNVAQRIAYCEWVAKSSQVVIDEAAGDIQPIGSTPSAGNSGKAGDAKHAHVGVHTVNGQTGDVTIDVNAVTENVYTITGQLVCGTGTGQGDHFNPGPDNGHLECDSTQTHGLKWRQKGDTTHCEGDCKKVCYPVPKTGWLVANGGPCSRTTYPNLWAASIITISSVTFNGTQTISGLSSSITPFIKTGMYVESSPYVPNGTTVTGVGTTSITVSHVTTSGTGTILIYLFGNGDGVTTFNCISLADPGDGTHWHVKCDS